MDLALVIGGATGQDPVANNDGLERRRGPELRRVHRLDIVMAVDEHGRGVRGVQPVRIDDGMTTRLERLGMLQARGGQVVDQPVRRPPAVARVLRERRDARDPQEVLVGLQASVAGACQVNFKGGLSFEGGCLSDHGPRLS